MTASTMAPRDWKHEFDALLQFNEREALAERQLEGRRRGGRSSE